MFDDRTEDNTPVLKELDSIITQEPTLEELDKEEDHLEFTNNTTWTFTEEERKRIDNEVSLEEPILTGGSSSSGTAGILSEDSPTNISKGQSCSNRKEYCPKEYRSRQEEIYPNAKT